MLAVENRAEPWPVIEGCHAAQLSDAALAWLVKGKVIAHEQRGDAAAEPRDLRVSQASKSHCGKRTTRSRPAALDKL